MNVNTVPSLTQYHRWMTTTSLRRKKEKNHSIYWSSNEIHDTNMYQEIHHTLKLADSGQYEQKTTAKICTCNKCHNNTHDICFYIPFCTIFVCLGIIQIIAGIFYFITIPVIKLIFNVVIGCWVRYTLHTYHITINYHKRKNRNYFGIFFYLQAILCGISGTMVACVCPSVPRKHEFLLYCSLSVLILNIINLILLEIGQVREIFNEHLQKALSKQEYDFIQSENGLYLIRQFIRKNSIEFIRCFFSFEQVVL